MGAACNTACPGGYEKDEDKEVSPVRLEYLAKPSEIDWEKLPPTDDGTQPRAPLWSRPPNKKKPRKVLMIVNPVSGGVSGQKKKEGQVAEATKTFKEAGIETEVKNTEKEGHAREMLSTMPLNMDAVIVLGGDGTVSEVVDGMLKRRDGQTVPIGVLPGGSGNALLENIQQIPGGSGQNDPDGIWHAALDAITGGCMQRADIGRIRYSSNGQQTVRHFALLMGWGDTYDFLYHAEGMKWAGASRYHMEAAYRGMKGYPEREAKLNVDGVEVTDFNQIIVLNFQDLFVQHYNPLGTADDGILEIIVKPYMSGMQDLQLTGALMKDRQFYDTPPERALRHFHGSQFTLDVPMAELDSHDRRLMVDGALIDEPCMPATIDNVRGAVEFFVVPQSD